MPNPPPDLGRHQRWMQAVITHSGGVTAGVKAARQEIDPVALEDVVTRSRALSAADRLAIYSHAYRARLLECLREEYPALAFALGQEIFDEFAVGYLDRYPPHTYTLHHLGAAFPRYLSETCPPDEDPHWAALLVDVATLERLYADVFDGPGSEGREPMPLDLSPAAFAAARLLPAPDLRLVELRSPVHEFIRAVRRNQPPAPPEPAETLLAVHRRKYVIRRHRLTRPQFALLAALVAGNTVGDAIGAAVAVAGDDLPLARWFRAWAAEGFFRGVDSPA